MKSNSTSKTSPPKLLFRCLSPFGESTRRGREAEGLGEAYFLNKMKHLERAIDGQNKFWKYLVMALAVFIGGQMVGSIPLIIAMGIVFVKTGSMPSGMSNGMPDFSVIGMSSSVTLAMMVFIFAVMLIVFALLVKPMHKRTLTETINGRKRIRWNRIYMGILVWGIIQILSFVISYIVSPEDIEFQFRPWPFISLLLVVIILLPFQTTCEEVLFRGYLSQGIGAWTRNRWVVLFVVSMLFALMHSANPEVKEFGFWLMMPNYLIMGLFLGLISILDDGIELAIGVHFINNASAAILTTHESSVFQTDALFKITHLEVTVNDIFIGAAWTILAILIFWRIYKWNFGIMNKKIEAVLPPVPQFSEEIKS